MEMAQENSIPQDESVVDADLVAIFDLLAQWDFEDKQKEKAALKTDPRSSSPGGQF